MLCYTDHCISITTVSCANSTQFKHRIRLLSYKVGGKTPYKDPPFPFNLVAQHIALRAILSFLYFSLLWIGL